MGLFGHAPEVRSDFTLYDGDGRPTRYVQKTPDSIREARAILRGVYGIPDHLDRVLDDVVRAAVRRL